jgi:hypothetical protein
MTRPLSAGCGGSSPATRCAGRQRTLGRMFTGEFRRLSIIRAHARARAHTHARMHREGSSRMFIGEISATNDRRRMVRRRGMLGPAAGRGAFILENEPSGGGSRTGLHGGVFMRRRLHARVRSCQSICCAPGRAQASTHARARAHAYANAHAHKPHAQTRTYAHVCANTHMLVCALHCEK